MVASDKWSSASAGGGHSSPKISDMFRLQGNKELVWDQNGELVPEALGLNKGNVCTWNKTLQLAGSGTPQALDEDKDPVRVPVVDIPVSATVQEYGKAVGWTGQLEALSKWDISDRAQRLLMEDQVHTIEYLIYSQFITGEFTACITGTTKSAITFTTNGTIAATMTNFLNRLTFIGVLDYAEQKLIPKIGGKSGTYRAILSVKNCSDLQDDVIELEKYVKPEAVLRSEVGMISNCRVMRDNGLLGNVVTSPYQGVVFGDDAVASCIAQPSYVSYEPGKHKRSPELAWFTTRAYKKIWSLANDDLNSVGTGIERIIRIGSAS